MHIAFKSVNSINTFGKMFGFATFNTLSPKDVTRKFQFFFQFICEKIVYPELLEVEDLDETERGEGGFGSTGTN